ncbi:MAG: hypothetical protein ACKVOO_07030 [Burkholderiaceae bacterium]
MTFSRSLGLCATLLLAASSWAAGPHSDQEVKQDIARHKAMAAAHTAAAQCLQSGKAHDICNKELQAACKGLAVGKYCGMKHAH